MIIEPQSGFSAAHSGTSVSDETGVFAPSCAEALTGTSGVSAGASG